MSEGLVVIASRAQAFTGSSGVAIVLREGGELVCRASWGTSAPEVGVRLDLGERSLVGQCVGSAQPLYCDDSENDHRVDPAACRALGVRAIVVVPVRQGGTVAGVIAAFSDAPRAFTGKHVHILTTLAEEIAGYLDEGGATPTAVGSSASVPDTVTTSDIQSRSGAVAAILPAEKATSEPSLAKVEELDTAKSATPTVGTSFAQGNDRSLTPASDNPAAVDPVEVPAAPGSELRKKATLPSEDPLPAGPRPQVKDAAITQAPVSAPSLQKVLAKGPGTAGSERARWRRSKLVFAAVAGSAALCLGGWQLGFGKGLVDGLHMDTLITFAIPAIILGAFLLSYRTGQKKRDAAAHAAAEKGKLHSAGPQSQYPHIDTTYCIGCAGCTTVCPEGDVLAMFGGKAVIVNGHKCIGHSLCAEACPVGAITMVTAGASVGGDNPYLTPDHETSISNLFIVGELGGLALIKNAINEGRDCVDQISQRFQEVPKSAPDVYDLLIVGTGPAGISAALRAVENKLKYLALEQEEEIGGTVAKYPRQKLVMTSPVQFPTYGKFKKMELSKEELITFWHKVMERADFQVRTGEKVQDIKKGEDDIFTVVGSKDQYRARAIVLALGKTGSPRKLGVKGEELAKVMYRLIEADHYINKQILVVGGGDSAIEAAMGLAHQVGNKVTLSYRKEAFSRIKERNTTRIQECISTGTVKVIFNSAPVEFKEDAVLLEVNGKVEEIPNNFVWIFAGGEPPTAFLKKIGIGFGQQDMTLQGGLEAKQAKKELAESRLGVS